MCICVATASALSKFSINALATPLADDLFHGSDKIVNEFVAIQRPRWAGTGNCPCENLSTNAMLDIVFVNHEIRSIPACSMRERYDA